MCWVCAEWVRAGLTQKEALRTLPELILTGDIEGDEQLAHLDLFADTLPQEVK